MPGKSENRPVVVGLSVSADGGLKLLQRGGIARLEGNVRQAFLQADVDRSNSRNGQEGHAHGVGTNLPIHAEDVRVNTETVYSARREADLVMTSIGEVPIGTHISPYSIECGCIWSKGAFG
jgi:hypothetical protein